ncbi:C2H2 type zinc finger domain-containing protein [Zalerion maritima]|uniref:C2H2 type zinc finger domain-containing protein n=1 Tax=Zalerion maritima TaxID=339359 RepID=A0AAD5RKR6_9PEZI|nr:C2H2 type zinc finger domain-containing protein [Zalerion maritima]
MDQQTSRDRSPSQGHQMPNINQSHSSPPPTAFQNDHSSIGLGLGLDPSNSSSTVQDQQQHQQSYQQQLSFDNGANYMSNQQLSEVPTDPALAQDSSTPPISSPFAPQQQSYSLSPGYPSGDFPLFQPTTSAPADQYSSAPLFEQQSGPQEMSNMASPQTHHTPTPPHLLNPDPHQPPPGHQSPSFNNGQFTPQGHSRNASLGPENALLPGQITSGWEGAAFQGHRRTPSEYSEVSSVAPSPNLTSTDHFDQLSQGHSPMQRPQDGSLYDSVGFESFTISDNQPHSSPNPGRSPSHSPAISPRVMPQQMTGAPSQFALQSSGPYMQPPPAFAMPPQGEAFPSLPSEGMGGDMSQVPMTTPSISFTPAPQPGAPPGAFDGPKPHLDADSLTPPESRGRQRRRAHTDPYNTAGGGGVLARPPGSLSPHLGAELRSDSRSLSPLDRQQSPSNRRKSIGSVPNNEMALRLADPEYGQEGGAGGAKRQQKHPATFSCHLCPKKFTRAYNLRSHLRTHTDERPFVCSVCGKAFARQHDRKRHEGLHSGEKKFVCKGDLKQGGQWGCGRRFARADALGRHFRSEAGRICIKPLLDEEMMERQRAWHEQRMQQSLAAQQMAQPHMMGDPNAGYPIDPSGGYALPQALLTQYPALAQMNWAQPDMSGGGSGLEDDLSGRSSFDASDYEGSEEPGYVSGPGSGFGPGGMNENYGEVGYASDFGPRS